MLITKKFQIRKKLLRNLSCNHPVYAADSGANFLLKEKFNGFCIIEQDPENTVEFNPDKLAKNNLSFVEKIINEYK